MESRPPVSLGTAAPFKYRIKPPSLETKLLGRDSRKWAFSFPRNSRFCFHEILIRCNHRLFYCILIQYNIYITLHYFEPEDRLL